jgi:hypothetical protein
MVSGRLGQVQEWIESRERKIMSTEGRLVLERETVKEKEGEIRTRKGKGKEKEKENGKEKGINHKCPPPPSNSNSSTLDQLLHSQ